MALLGNKHIKLIAACDTNEENLKEWGHYVKEANTFSSNFEMYKSIPTPDIITVAVNEDSHIEECLAAIETKPRLIILEKPVTLNSTQAAEIAVAAAAFSALDLIFWEPKEESALVTAMLNSTDERNQSFTLAFIHSQKIKAFICQKRQATFQI